MLGPLRSSRASSLGQAGVFLFVCCLITCTLGSNRLFQQVPQNNTRSNATQTGTTNQTTTVYVINPRPMDNSGGGDAGILVLSIGGFVVIIVLIGLVYFAIKGHKEAQRNARNPDSGKEASQELSNNQPQPALPPVPHSAVLAQNSDIIHNLRNHILGEPDRQAQVSPVQPPITAQLVPEATKKPKKLKKIPSMVIMELRNHRAARSHQSVGLQDTANIHRYQVPLGCLDVVAQIEFVDIPEVPVENTLAT